MANRLAEPANRNTMTQNMRWQFSCLFFFYLELPSSMMPRQMFAWFFRSDFFPFELFIMCFFTCFFFAFEKWWAPRFSACEVAKESGKYHFSDAFVGFSDWNALERSEILSAKQRKMTCVIDNMLARNMESMWSWMCCMHKFIIGWRFWTSARSELFNWRKKLF